MTSLPGDTASNGETIKVFDVPVTTCTFAAGVNLIETIIAERKSQLVVLANANTLNLAYDQSDYKKILQTALVLRDGSGVSWAMQIKGVSPLHNFVGTDFVPAFCKLTAHKGYRIFLLGARSGVAEAAAKKLESLAPGLIIAGYYHGYFPEDRTDEIIRRIEQTGSDILLVAMGNPKQEFWITNNIYKLNIPVCIGVGAFFDYLSDQVPRAPQWMLSAGMEWIFRLAMEPKRLWRRYLIGNVKFIMRVYREHM
ncbi:MAG: WecB/TagA/CpsF family glycosyltransferase [Proteobacteria bacterium]|nr:WecB/TagA/CpsF family glycosyltransferase [Pseudomonadota bacterium]